MKRTVIGGVALALVAVVAVYVGEALNLGLPTPLLGIAAGGVLALAPGGHKLGRLVGFLVGVLISVVGYGLSAGFLPASSGGTAVQVLVVFLLVTAAAALSFGRMPLWSVLLGAGAFAGAYDWIYQDKPYNYLTSVVQVLGTFLVLFGLGYLTAALVDWLFPEESAEQAAGQAELDYATVGSEQ